MRGSGSAVAAKVSDRRYLPPFFQSESLPFFTRSSQGNRQGWFARNRPSGRVAAHL